jgi:predicted nucleic acid-binding protein
MCGGETEEIYFNHYKSRHKRDLQNISVKVVAHKKSNPMAVVQAALIQKAEYDEVWAVFDKDDFADFDDAIVFALSKGIKCAFSNEAIEYWFFLHFENKTGAMTRSALNSELQKRLGFEYDKGAEIIERTCRNISSKLLIAEERAQIGHERHIVNSGYKPSDWCSCTTIYSLTKRLREWSKAKK